MQTELEQWLNHGILVAAKRLQEKHELCNRILDVINQAERKRRNSTDQAEGQIGNLYPGLKVKYEHKSEISMMAIERLWRRYFKVCTGLVE